MQANVARPAQQPSGQQPSTPANKPHTTATDADLDYDNEDYYVYDSDELNATSEPSPAAGTAAAGAGVRPADGYHAMYTSTLPPQPMMPGPGFFSSTLNKVTCREAYWTVDSLYPYNKLYSNYSPVSADGC